MLLGRQLRSAEKMFNSTQIQNRVTDSYTYSMLRLQKVYPSLNNNVKAPRNSLDIAYLLLFLTCPQHGHNKSTVVYVSLCKIIIA